jgi:hypothetical protein
MHVANAACICVALHWSNVSGSNKQQTTSNKQTTIKEREVALF